MAEISDLDLYGKFFKLCAALTTREINYSQIGRDLGMNPKTAQNWLSLLKASFQWYDLPAYSGNVIKRLSSKPKGFLSDTEMICYALSIFQPDTVMTHPSWGNIFESAVFLEIKKLSKILPHEPQMYHWRTGAGAEVDLLLEYNAWFYPIEVKAKSHPTKKDASGIRSFKDTYPHLKIADGIILAPTESSYQVYPDVTVVPWDATF